MNFIFSLYLFIFSFFHEQPIDLNTRFNTGQLIVVTTNSWNKIEGKMSVYKYKGNRWVPVFTKIPIVTGRSGMAWGKGLHKAELNRGKLKKEGDGNSPAGIFHLSGLFGYEDIRSEMNSMKVDDRTFCIDDSKSAYYNQIVKSDTVKKDWNSAETMRMKSDVYKFGIFVDYNVKPAIPNMGSCIFMHIWSGSNKPTAGCTAMKESDILKLIDFLDKRKNPILVQVPQSEYSKLKGMYKLP
ncbi:L,D-transpeptidase [Daejeonella sp.]|uniref:L,D-transpeptidase family protein n=1 Tax=Daejeonella sp. TaxID=2805397 RepID=UPI002717285D|nr:L,D-transpeptidase family protein [Daejeonella sp.]MDO8993269.1 L,D-transpeptidase family protein [Daejeonella sp.]MDP2413988.1 L,D-transpeptidase family protein [Daejeonella sp.]